MQTQNEAPHIRLATMSRWYVVSRAIHAIASLGIANCMTETPVSVKEIAAKSGTDPELLGRLMQFLSSYGLFEYQTPDAYALTELSKPLRDDDPHSVRDVLRMVDDNWWDAFSMLDQSIKNGKSAFEHKHGEEFFTFLSNHAEKQANFDRGMAKLSTYDDEPIAKCYNFGRFHSLADMGGGRGGMAKAIHKYYPELSITVFDTPSVIDQLSNSDFPSEIQLQAGDFFAEIPMVDAYLYKGVLHDFNDEMMKTILTNCYQRMPQSSTLLIAEQVMPVNDLPHPNKTMDIVMMVLLDGRQRSLAEWQQCIEPAGFEFVNSYPTSSVFTLMEFKRKS